MKVNKEALVSIIMPAFNCENYIGEAIESVTNQTYNNWELIIVNDCSTDDTDEVIRKYMEREKRIKYYMLEYNSGAAMARNKAINLATGKYIAFLDSDDIWFPEKLIKQINFMKDNEYDFTCTSYTKINGNGNYLNKTIVAKAKSDYEGILKTCPGNSTVIYNANKLGKIIIPDIKKRNDYVMWLQMVKKSKYLYGMKIPLGSHRITESGISSNKKSLIRYHWSVYRKIEKLSMIESCYLIIYWVVATVFKLR